MTEIDGTIPPGGRFPDSPDFPSGPLVGDPFPDVSATNQYGEVVGLHDARRGRPAVVILHRSARWCGVCRTQLTNFQRYLPHFEQAGVAVFAISPDPVPHLAEFAFEEGVTFPLLSDDGSAFIRRLGILNDLISPHEPRYGIPFPGVYALSADGTVHHKYFYQHYRERIAPLGILLDAYGRSLAPMALPTARGDVNGEQIVATLASEQLTPFEHTPLSIQVAGGAESLVRIDGGESITVSDMQERASENSTGVTAWLMASTVEPQELTLDIEVTPPAGGLVRLSVAVSLQGINRGR